MNLRIESVNAEIEGTDFDKQKTKRKKDGVFYTPKYITKYIVDNTIGKLCTEKKDELNILEEDFNPKRQKETKKKLLASLETYREWLLQLTICDPACGSGAFLNQALDFLIKEHQDIDELQTTLLGGGFVFPNIENTVLENNIFGVDLNEESVEIAKLSLWLRTAQPRRKLNTLNNNIKCGNSLIDSKSVAGDKAFNWEKEFPQVFKEKEKKVWHITTATHNSRYSQRMFDYKVKTGNAEWIDEEDEIIITKTIAVIVKKDKLNVIEYNVCGDHMHLLLVCEENELTGIVGKIKAMTSRARNIAKGYTITKNESDTTIGHDPLSASMATTDRGETQTKLWTQKFGTSEVKDEEYLNNSIAYIQDNRIKHELPKSKAIEKLKKEFLCSTNHAFRPEKKGGFDVVIGNPPYLRVQGLRENFEKESQFYEKIFESATGRFDVYVLFMEKSFQLIKQEGIVSFILPHKFLVSDFGEGIRGFFAKNKAVSNLVHFGSEMVFEDASAYTCIINLTHNNSDFKFKQIKPSEIFDHSDFDVANYDSLSGEKWNLKNENTDKLFKKLHSQPWTVKDVFENISQGVVSVGDDIFLMQGEIKGNKFIGFSDKIGSEITLEANIVKPLLKGEDVKKYAPLNNTYYCLYPHFEKEGKTIPFDEDYLKKKFPLAYNYILPFKDELIEKKIRYKTNPTAWYSLHRSREISLFEQEKIITPEISLGTNMTLDLNNKYHNTKCYTLAKKASIIENNKYWLAILNSKLLWFFLSSTGYILRGGFFTFKTKYLEPFPLPKIENIDLQNPFIEKVDITLSNTKDFSLIKNKFTTYLQSQFSIEKVSKKIQNWHELDFAEFIKELNKAIKKVGGEKLTKTDEMDWMDVFETKKAEAQILKTEIDKTDKDIDQMVYELYGLSEEEIKIIEKDK